MMYSERTIVITSWFVSLLAVIGLVTVIKWVTSLTWDYVLIRRTERQACADELAKLKGQVAKLEYDLESARRISVSWTNEERRSYEKETSQSS